MNRRERNEMLSKSPLGRPVSAKPGWKPWWPSGERVPIKAVLRNPRGPVAREKSRGQQRHEATNARRHREAELRKAARQQGVALDTLTKAQAKEAFRALLRARPTHAETYLSDHLKRLKIPFDFQPIVCGYIPDFGFEHNLLVELDGPIHDDQKAYDERRDSHLKAKGYTVLRFTNDCLFERPNEVLGAIQKALA